MKRHKFKLPMKDTAEVDIPPTTAEKMAAKAQEALAQAQAEGSGENACGEANRRFYRRRPGPRAGGRGRPSKGPAALRPTSEDVPEELTDAAAVLTPDMIVPGERLKILDRVKRKRGESAMAYLDRVSPDLVEELVIMAMSPTSQIHPRIKLDIMKELLSRPLPVKTVTEAHYTVSDLDRMSDEEVYEEIQQRLKSLKETKKLPPPPSGDGDLVH